MKMCMPHWNALRQAIDDRGLTPLVARSGEEAAAAVQRQIEKTDAAIDFDPLMSANFGIIARALRLGGLYLMALDDDGNHLCPLCEVDKHGGIAQDWIVGCCDAQLATARDLGLVPKVQ